MEMGKIRIVLIILTIVCHRLYIGIVLAKRRVCGKVFGETSRVKSILPYIFHIRPLLIFKKESLWSHFLSDFLEIFPFKSRINQSILIFSYNFWTFYYLHTLWFKLENVITPNLNTNVNARHHNFLWLYIARFGEKL
jgi:hypothetical protein